MRKILAIAAALLLVAATANAANPNTGPPDQANIANSAGQIGSLTTEATVNDYGGAVLIVDVATNGTNETGVPTVGENESGNAAAPMDTGGDLNAEENGPMVMRNGHETGSVVESTRGPGEVVGTGFIHDSSVGSERAGVHAPPNSNCNDSTAG